MILTNICQVILKKLSKYWSFFENQIRNWWKFLKNGILIIISESIAFYLKNTFYIIEIGPVVLSLSFIENFIKKVLLIRLSILQRKWIFQLLRGCYWRYLTTVHNLWSGMDLRSFWMPFKIFKFNNFVVNLKKSTFQ